MSVIFLFVGFSAFADTAKICAKIVDDGTGLPVEGVSVVGSFRDDIGWRAWTESAKPDLDRKISAGTGCAVCRERQIAAMPAFG